MKQLARLAALALIGSVLSTESDAACDRALTVSWTDWKPYQFQDGDNGAVKGIDIDIIDAVLTAVGCRYSLRFLPWKRSLAEIEAGILDLTGSASRTAEREKYAYFTSPYRREYQVFFMHRDDIRQYRFNSIEAVTNYPHLRIGVLRGVWYGEAFNGLRNGDPDFAKQVYVNSSHDQLFNWLMRGHIDLLTNDLYNGLYTLRDLGVSQTFTAHPTIVNDDPVHLIISRKSVRRDLFDRINSTVRDLYAEGRFEAIINRYIPNPQMNFFPQDLD